MQVLGKFTHIGHDDFVAALMLAVNALPDTKEIFYAVSSSNPEAEKFKNPFEDEYRMPQLIVTNRDEIL